MSVTTFRWLSDIERFVRTKVDQPVDEPGQPGFRWDAEFQQNANLSYRWVHERISSIDRNFGVKTTTIAVSAGATTTALPASLRVLRKVFLLRGTTPCAIIRLSSFDELGAWCPGTSAVFRPSEGDLYWTGRPRSAFSILVVYEEHPVPLIHGCALDGGGSTIQLAEHESDQNDLHVGTEIRLTDGDGAGQERTGLLYNGLTKVLTVDSAWTSGTPTAQTRYTSKPKLPPDALDVLVWDVCARMAEKLQDEKWNEFVQERETKLKHMATALASLDRQEPQYARDAMELGGHGDPLYS
jgi:hypothetical protein